MQSDPNPGQAIDLNLDPDGAVKDLYFCGAMALSSGWIADFATSWVSRAVGHCARARGRSVAVEVTQLSAGDAARVPARNVELRRNRLLGDIL